jgi:hypothetical protein
LPSACRPCRTLWQMSQFPPSPHKILSGLTSLIPARMTTISGCRSTTSCSNHRPSGRSHHRPLGVGAIRRRILLRSWGTGGDLSVDGKLGQVVCSGGTSPAMWVLSLSFTARVQRDHGGRFGGGGLVSSEPAPGLRVPCHVQEGSPAQKRRSGKINL